MSANTLSYGTIRSAAINIAAVVCSAVAGVVATSVLARNLPVEDFGRISILIAALNAVAIFEGLRPVVIVETARARFSFPVLYLAARRILFSIALTIGIVFATASLLVPGLYLGAVNTMLLVAAVLAFFVAVLEWAFLDARGETAFTGMARAGVWTLTFAALAIESFFSPAFEWYVFTLAAMNFGLALVLHRRLDARSSIGRRKVDPAVVRQLIRPMLENIATNISSVTINVTDRLVVGATLGAAAAGRYAGQQEFATKPAALVRAFTQVLLPTAAKISSDLPRLGRLWFGTTGVILAMSSIAAIVSVVWRETIVAWLLGDSFVPYADIFGVLISAFPLTLTGYFSVVCLNACGDFVSQRRWYAAAAAVLLVAVYPVARLQGILGVAVLFLIVRCVDLILLRQAIHLLNAASCARQLITGCAACALGLTLAWFHEPLIGCGLIACWLIWFHPQIARSIGELRLV